jgi:hypothetical protein
MNVLDENLPECEQQQLCRWRIRVRHIGYDFARQGIKDDQVIPLLHKLNRPTFFSRDGDYFNNKLCHAGYCLVFLDVDDVLVAEYVRRLLRHPAFNTRAKRLGRVIRLAPSGITFFAVRKNQEQHLSWQ